MDLLSYLKWTKHPNKIFETAVFNTEAIVKQRTVIHQRLGNKTRWSRGWVDFLGRVSRQQCRQRHPSRAQWIPWVEEMELEPSRPSGQSRQDRVLTMGEPHRKRTSEINGEVPPESLADYWSAHACEKTILGQGKGHLKGLKRNMACIDIGLGIVSGPSRQIE